MDCSSKLLTKTLPDPVYMLQDSVQNDIFG